MRTRIQLALCLTATPLLTLSFFGPAPAHGSAGTSALIQPAGPALTGFPEYIKSGDISGNLRFVGSSTVAQLVDLWSSALSVHQPGLLTDVSSPGSGAALSALLSGSADIAPMSRPMNAAELKQFKDKFGYDITRVVVAVDALAVFVHKDNPVESLTLTQLDSIFSASRKRGGPPASTWGQVGLTGEWGARPIRVFGFGETAGGYALFKDLVLDGGEYVSSLKVEPGSSSIVNAVGAYKEGVGFSSQFFKTTRTRMVPIVGADGVAHTPDEQSCLSGEYPLARRLFLYVNKKPGQPLPDKSLEFISFALSRQGQESVVAQSMFAITPELAREQLAALQR